MSQKVLELRQIRKHYPIKGGLFGKSVGHVRALDGVDLDVAYGKTLGLVGESGSGKSTLGRIALRLTDTTEGSVVFDGEDITHLGGQQLRRRRTNMQMVFQDPYSSMDPMATVADAITEPMRTHGYPRAQRAGRVDELLEMVGLRPLHRS